MRIPARERKSCSRRLLQQTQMSLVEVSVACGFESASYFSRAYRTRFGVTPSGDRVAVVTAPRVSTRVATRDELVSTG